MIKNDKLYIVIIFISLIISAYSQSPSFQDDTSVYTVVWIIPFAYLLLHSKLNISPIKSILIYFIIFQIYVSILQLVMPIYMYRNDTNVNFSPIAIFILLIGAGSYKLITIETFKKLLLFSSVICLIYLEFVINISGYTDIYSTIQYQSSYKNQISPILVSHVSIISCFINQKKKINKLFYYVLLAITIYVIFSLKSRGGMLSLLIMLAFLLFYFKDRTTKNFFVIAILFSCIYFYFNWDSYRDIVFQNVFKNSDDLTTISSGRDRLWSLAFERLNDNVFFGVGQKAGNIENFYLQNLTAFGIFGFWLSMSFIYIPIKKLFKDFDKNSQFELIAMLFVILYYLSGLFERTPPIGPGIRCFYLWFILGYVISMKYERRINK